MKMVRSLILVAVALPMCIFSQGCGSAPDPWTGLGESPRIVTSFPPIACFARNVAGEKASIVCICTSKGPHGYEANLDDTLKMRRAEVLFTNGLGLDDGFSQKLKVNAPATLRHLSVGDKVKPGLRLDDGENPDPHLWLGIEQAKAMVDHMADALKEVGDKNVDYTANAEAYKKKLDELHEYGKKQLSGIKTPIVTFHESLNYFAKSFGLTIAASIHDVVGGEVGAARLRELIKVCKEKKVEIIAVEPQYPDQDAKVLKAELEKQGLKNIRLVQVDPLETCQPGEEDEKDWYVRKMKQNIDNLAGTSK